MVAYIRSDLDFILAQIKIAEAHCGAGQPLFRTGRADPDLQSRLGPAHGRRHLQQPAAARNWGAADNEFPEPLGTHSGTDHGRSRRTWPGAAWFPLPTRRASTIDGSGRSGRIRAMSFDPNVRTISNLIVDQTLGNPSAILTGAAARRDRGA